MKNITNLERSLYKDILMTIMIVLISIPIWLNLDMSAYAMEADNYANYNYVKYSVLNQADKTLKSFDDKEALMFCETSDILVYNDSNTIDNYSLVLKVSKDNMANIENVRINVNYDVKNLNEYHSYEDAESYYYVIDSGNLLATSQKYIVSLWNSKKDNNQSFNYEFVLV